MKNLLLDLTRATEAGAIAASDWIGSGNKEQADLAATEAMRNRLNKCSSLAAKVVIGEGKKDKSYGLFEGELVGGLKDSQPSLVFPDATIWRDLAVDPIEGTRPTVYGRWGAISTLALADENCMFSTECFYMNKLAWGPIVHALHGDRLSIANPLHVNLKYVSQALEKPLSRLTVCVLDRPRHASIIQELRALKCRIRLIQDCDVSASIAVCLPDRGIDLMYGIGGAPEAVLSAAAIKCLGGGFESQIVFESTKQDYDTKLVSHSMDGSSYLYATGDILTDRKLVNGHCCFCATGITNGSLLEGVRTIGQRYRTHSVCMRSESQTVRWITAYHGN